MYRSFRIWLILIFTVSILAPLAILSTALATYMGRTFIAETESIFEYSLRSVSNRIENYATELGHLTLEPYFNADLMGALQDLNSSRYTESFFVQANVHRAIHAAFSKQLAIPRSDVLGVLFVPYSENTDVGILVRRHAGSVQIIRMPEARQSDWFKNAIEANGAVYFTQTEFPDYLRLPPHMAFLSPENMNIFSVARLIKNPYTMRPVGVIKVNASDSMLHEILNDVPARPSSILMLIDEYDQLIYSRGVITPDLHAGVAAGENRINTERDSYIVSIAAIASAPWRLCYLASERDIRALTNSIYLVTAFFGLIFLCAALFLFHYNSRKSVRAMNELLSSMKKISQGNFEINLEIPKMGYFSQIAEALNKTSKRLETHIKNEYAAILNQRNAELVALQSQINPHFLSNVLSGFVTLNRIGEKDTLEESIVCLGRMFRYVSSTDNHSTLENELTFIEEYLMLQKMRFGDSITYEISCNQNALSILFPKLLLQPLIENAVIHGMGTRTNHLHVEVLVDVCDIHPKMRQLSIIITDNGVGFNAEKIGPNSIGISNTKERLKLFNAAAEFDIISSPGNGCKCTVTIPSIVTT